MPHGYTNATGRFGGVVRKSYLGPDRGVRSGVEYSALIGLAGRFPVPVVLSCSEGELRVAEVIGSHGQEVLDGPDLDRARGVLRSCGSLRRELSAIDPATSAFRE